MKKDHRDRNEPDIVEALLGIGCLVMRLQGGGGRPDLLVACPPIVTRDGYGTEYRRTLKLMEVKDGAKFPSDRKLSSSQVAFHQQWGQTPIRVVLTPEDAVAFARESAR